MYKTIIDKYLKQSKSYQSGGFKPKLQTSNNKLTTPKTSVLDITQPDGSVKKVDWSSDEYKKLYNSRQLLTQKTGTDEYTAIPYQPVEIIAKKDPTYKPYTKQQFVDDRAGVFGNITDANNMPASMESQYQAELNERAAKRVLDRIPQPNGNKASEADNLKWYHLLSEDERQAVRSSKYSNEFLPAERAYNINQSNKAQSNGFFNGLRPDNLALATKGTPERLRLFPNAKNNIESYANPGVIAGDMVEGLGTVPKNIKEGNYISAALGVGVPLLGGVLGSETKGLLPFVNGVFNPLAGLNPLSKSQKVADNMKSMGKLIQKKNEKSAAKILATNSEIKVLPVYAKKGVKPQTIPYGIINGRFRHTYPMLEDLKNTYRAEWEKLHGAIYDEKDLGLYAKMRDMEVNPVIQKVKDKVEKDVVKVMQKQGTNLKYTPREELIIDAYTRGYDRVLNKRESRNHKFYDEVVRPELEQLLLKNKTNRPQTVHRATWNHEATIERNGQPMQIPFEDMEEGDVYIPNSFLSTSIDKNRINGFGDIAMEINLPKKQSYGLFGAAPSNTYAKIEKEILLPEKLKYTIEKKTGDPRFKNLSEMKENVTYAGENNAAYTKNNGIIYKNGRPVPPNEDWLTLYDINKFKNNRKFKMSIKNPYVTAPVIPSAYLLNNNRQQNNNQ